MMTRVFGVVVLVGTQMRASRGAVDPSSTATTPRSEPFKDGVADAVAPVVGPPRTQKDSNRPSRTIVAVSEFAIDDVVDRNAPSAASFWVGGVEYWIAA